MGGSTRAAAWSAVRAGWTPICADLFADLDTRQVAEIVPVRDFPTSLPEDVASVQAGGWFYTGGLENHPDIIERMLRPDASYGPLWGTPPAALRLVRDPFWLAETLQAAGLPALDVLPESSPPPADGTWLQKPLASAGGRAIRVWNREAASRDFGEPHYFQRRAAGVSCSAVFRALGGKVEWLGATQQLISPVAPRESQPFAYGGSIGPIDQLDNSPCPLTDKQIDRVFRLAETVASASHLFGLFGIDFLVNVNEVNVVEVNPRYTASVEILELSGWESLLSRVFENESIKSSGRRRKLQAACVAKWILYAPQQWVAPDFSRYLQSDSPWDVPYLADVPAPGTVIQTGWPICTVFANGHPARQFESQAKTRLDTIWKLCLAANGSTTS